MNSLFCKNRKKFRDYPELFYFKIIRLLPCKKHIFLVACIWIKREILVKTDEILFLDMV